MRTIFDLPGFKSQIAPPANQRDTFFPYKGNITCRTQRQLLLSKQPHAAVLRLYLYRPFPGFDAQLTGSGKQSQLLSGQRGQVAHCSGTDITSGVDSHISCCTHLHIFTAGQRHSFRCREKHGFIERFQPLLKHLYLTVNISLQRLCPFCGDFQLLQLQIKPVDFLQRGIHVQCLALCFRLRIRSNKKSLPCSQGSPLIGTQLCAFTPQLPLAVHQMPAVKLCLTVLCGEFDMLFATPVLHPQL